MGLILYPDEVFSLDYMVSHLIKWTQRMVDPFILHVTPFPFRVVGSQGTRVPTHIYIEAKEFMRRNILFSYSSTPFSLIKIDRKSLQT